FAVGLVGVGVLSAVESLEVMTLRRLGRHAARRLALAGPALVLLVLAALAMGGVAALGDPFEDSYHHWLISATLAATGQLHDPLFGMEDSWLPAYHLVRAAVLRVFGLWNLTALRPPTSDWLCSRRGRGHLGGRARQRRRQPGGAPGRFHRVHGAGLPAAAGPGPGRPAGRGPQPRGAGAPAGLARAGAGLPGDRGGTGGRGRLQRQPSLPVPGAAGLGGARFGGPGPAAGRGHHDGGRRRRPAHDRLSARLHQLRRR